jgi:hypothetical protein
VRLAKKNMTGPRDDSLYGLLSSYKSNYTYIQVLVSDANHSIIVRLTDNPKNFFSIPPEKYLGYRLLRRLEMGIIKMSLKYLSPQNLIVVLGPLLGINVPPEKVVVTDSIKKCGYYSIEAPIRYKMRVIQGVKKLVNMSPQKRYEILEKYFSMGQV